MPKPQSTQTPQPKVGRPATGATRTKISITIPTALHKAATKQAATKSESLSQFVSRAIQNLTMES